MRRWHDGTGMGLAMSRGMIEEHGGKLLYSGGYKNGCNGRILLVHDMKDPMNPVLIGDGVELPPPPAPRRSSSM